MAAVRTDPKKTVVVDAVVGCQCRITNSCLGFAEDEARAESALEACLIVLVKNKKIFLLYCDSEGLESPISRTVL